MITADDLFDHARTMLVQAAAAADETLLRRSVSTAYYALFHLLARAGSRVVAGGVEQTAAKVARAYNHSVMHKVCEAGRLLVVGLSARHDFDAIRHLPEATPFLVALLLSDRWGRG